MKIEVDFVESEVYFRGDQKRESSYVGVLYIHACIYVKKSFLQLIKRIVSNKEGTGESYICNNSVILCRNMQLLKRIANIFHLYANQQSYSVYIWAR